MAALIKKVRVYLLLPENFFIFFFSMLLRESSVKYLSLKKRRGDSVVVISTKCHQLNDCFRNLRTSYFN